MLRRATAAGLFAVFSLAACSGRVTSVELTPVDGGAVDADALDGADAARAPCTAKPGQFPAANCELSENKCTPVRGCVIDEAKCGSASTCLPMKASSSTSVLDFRLRRLNVIAPPSLAYATSPVVQTVLINDSLSLNAKACGELGKGSFNWLLRLDNEKGMITTGGAPPSVDPFGSGYCFFDHAIGAIDVRPATVRARATAGGYESDAIAKLNMPIFLDNTGTSVILLPLSSAVLKNVAVSSDGSCIGAFNASALDADCFEDLSTCSKWKTGGSVGAFISLEDADAIFIKELNSSLCVLLTQSAPAKACPRDAAGKISARGDYCSTSQGPGACADSSWFAATFAASAVHVDDAAADPRCHR